MYRFHFNGYPCLQNSDLNSDYIMNTTVAIFPGRFQLPHKGHKYVYDCLTQLFGKCYIATSNHVDFKNNSPLNFKEKKQLLTYLGIPRNLIIETREPYRPYEIYQKIPKQKSIIVGIGDKDKRRFNALKSTSYFKDYKTSDPNNLNTKDQNAYLVYVPTYRYTFMGESIQSGTQLRNRYINLPYNEQKDFIFKLYETYNTRLHAMLSKRLEVYYD